MAPSSAPNPYAAPTSQSTASVDEAVWRELAGIAQAQRIVIFSILGYFVAIVVSAVLGQSEVGEIFATLLAAVVGIAGLVGGIMLAYRLSGLGLAIGAGIALIIPLVGFIVMLLLSGSANRRMKKAGVRVGLLGADPAQFQHD